MSAVYYAILWDSLELLPLYQKETRKISLLQARERVAFTKCRLDDYLEVVFSLIGFEEWLVEHFL